MDFAGFLSFYLLEQHVSEKELRSQDGNFLPAEGTWLILFKQQTTTVLCYLLTLRLIFWKYLTTLSGIVVLWLGLYHISWRYFRWKGIPWWFRDKESTCNGGDAEDTGSNPWVRKIPWKKKWQPTPVFLPGKSHGQRSPAGYSPWGHKRVGYNNKQQQCITLESKQS